MFLSFKLEHSTPNCVILALQLFNFGWRIILYSRHSWCKDSCIEAVWLVITRQWDTPWRSKTLLLWLLNCVCQQSLFLLNGLAVGFAAASGLDFRQSSGFSWSSPLGSGLLQGCIAQWLWSIMPSTDRNVGTERGRKCRLIATWQCSMVFWLLDMLALGSLTWDPMRSITGPNHFMLMDPCHQLQ